MLTGDLYLIYFHLFLYSFNTTRASKWGWTRVAEGEWTSLVQHIQHSLENVFTGDVRTHRGLRSKGIAHHLSITTDRYLHYHTTSPLPSYFPPKIPQKSPSTHALVHLLGLLGDSTPTSAAALSQKHCGHRARKATTAWNSSPLSLLAASQCSLPGYTLRHPFLSRFLRSVSQATDVGLVPVLLYKMSSKKIANISLTN